MTARDRLASTLAPELLAALEQLVDERVGQELERRLADGAHPAQSGSPWLSIAEAAGYLGTSERTVQRLVKRGRVRSSTIGRRRLLHRDDLDNAATREE
ncbi:MAG TPA: helix-turn-helix domain-containing protein [Plantibacter sp.]|uniref:helix-turn-helix domain-containing protein n=1 Tax=Plantibacter sp. TaxID=1871045 RepID=UPI002CB9662F|nr:helix-turn-helix domain-containing protein [Plantibacter sp.]